ncbi:hypothetical protein [Nocardia terpenica]|uniref:hypothetical protein n=1 Tax=Nocardia terpenica TaxID=455432 RepID=UPI003D161CAE
MVKQNAADGDNRQDRRAVPATVRGAGALAALEGLIGVIIAIVLVVQGTGAQSYGTAGWFAILAGAVLAAGVALLLGRRWGRAIVVIAQILLLPVAWYMFSSHRPELAVPVGLGALVTLGLLFSPPSTRWMAELYDSASED